MSKTKIAKVITIIGGGPTGLMAAEVVAMKGYAVHVFDAMPTMARKFLRAGIGGLNITFDEPLDAFLDKYSSRRNNIEAMLQKFTPEDLLAWVHDLGIETFVGSSHRVFPREKKAAPLLRAWLQRLRQSGVMFHPRHRWIGWNPDRSLRFTTPAGEVIIDSDVTLLALGGASWPQLGSDASWVELLTEKEIAIQPLRPANCGFIVNWSEYFKYRFAGQPIKAIVGFIRESGNEDFKKSGELMITETGIAGGLMYALSSRGRDEIERHGKAEMILDLSPDRSLQQLSKRLSEPRLSRSLTKHLKSKAGIVGIKAALLREYSDHTVFREPDRLAQLIKAFPITLVRPNPIAEVISTAGGVCFEALNSDLMIKKFPGLFCAGEMLDWEAPTGGYLLPACFASGYVAGHGMLQWLTEHCNGFFIDSNK